MKKILLSLLVISFGFQSYALTAISTKKVYGVPFCAGSSITIGYLVDAPANTGNVFSAELSDENGDFTSPVVIGSINKTTGGSIPCVIPLGMATSNKYRIRVVSSNPVVIGSESQNKVPINPKPNGLSVNNITACSATLNWASLPTADNYKVQYRITGSDTWSATLDAGAATSYTFSNLEAATNYDFKVRAVCANGEKSDWRKASAATSSCAIPTNFIVTVIGLTTSSLDWADAACSGGYLFRYRGYGEPDWINLTSATSNINLTGLLPATLYEAQVANVCGSGASEYTSSIIWETEYFRVAGNAGPEADLHVYPNPSNGIFNVSYTSSVDRSPVEISVQNVYGQVIKHVITKSVEGINSEEIDLPNVAAGVYLVSIRTGENEIMTSLVIR